MRTTFAVCPDHRCAESRVEPVSYPGGGPGNRCPTCFCTVQWRSSGDVQPLRTLVADVPTDPSGEKGS